MLKFLLTLALFALAGWLLSAAPNDGDPADPAPALQPPSSEVQRLQDNLERMKDQYADARQRTDRAGAKLTEALQELKTPSSADPSRPSSEKPSTAALPGGDGPTVVRTYRQAKRVLHDDIYRDHRRTLYCDCPYDADKNVQQKGCVATTTTSRRAKRIEWEHMVPASYFGSKRECWRVGHPDCDKPGRSCCEQPGVDLLYATMSSDMHNLAPAIGAVNARRSNYPYGETPETKDYGPCDFDIVDRVAEPADAVRGDVARAWLYMASTYSMPISPQQRALFEGWHAADPPDDWERTRNQRIERAQGNGNAFVTVPVQ